MKAKNNLTVLFLCAFISLVINGCIYDPGGDDKLRVKNISSNNIAFMTLSTHNLSLYFHNNPHGFYRVWTDSLGPNQLSKGLIPGDGNKGWEKYLNFTCQNGLLTVYSFNLDTLKKYSWEEIVDKDYYLSRKYYTLEQIEKLNWVISVP